MDATSLKQIVDLLKQPPLNRNESLVSLSSLSSSNLLQIVNDLFGHLDSRQRKDLREENADITLHRMIDFLCSTLHYSPFPNTATNGPTTFENVPAPFKTRFIAGEPAILFPILHFLLVNFQQLKERSYVGRFCRPFEIPHDFLLDASVSQLLNHLATMQADFEEKFKALETIRKNSFNTKSLSKEIRQLENEKVQLGIKLKKMREKIENEEKSEEKFEDRIAFGVSGAGNSTLNSSIREMISATNALRLQQEEEFKLVQSKENLASKIEYQQKKSSEILIDAEKFSNFVSLLEKQRAKNDLSKFFSAMRMEINEKKDYIENDLKYRAFEKESQIKALSSLFSAQNFTPEQIDQMERDIHSLSRENERLLAQCDEKNGKKDSKIGLLRERLAILDKKFQKCNHEIDELNNEKKELTEEMEKLQFDFANLSSKLLSMKSEEEMKEYMSKLAALTQSYKNKKAELENYTAENEAMQNEFEELSAECKDLSEFQKRMEKEKNIEGFGEMHSSLVSLSMMKKNLDEKKSENLEEISSIITEIQQKIKGEQQKLAPKIKELRDIQVDYENIESHWKSNKKDEEKRDLHWSSERNALDSEIKVYQKEVEKIRSSWHQFEAEKGKLQQREILIFGTGKAEKKQHSTKKTSYRQSIESKLSENEALIKQLKKEKKLLSTIHSNSDEQKTFFERLKNLLEKKERLMGEENQMNYMNMGNSNNSGGGFNSLKMDDYNDGAKKHESYESLMFD